MDKIKNILIAVLVPVILVGLSMVITGDVSPIYQMISKPSFSPPGYVFGIVWTILYGMMAYASFLILESDDPAKQKALVLYYVQLIINVMWSFIFFNMQAYFLGAVWIVVLLGFAILTAIEFYQIDNLAGLLFIPYILWLVFALILATSIFLMN